MTDRLRLTMSLAVAALVVSATVAPASATRDDLAQVQQSIPQITSADLERSKLPLDPHMHELQRNTFPMEARTAPLEREDQDGTESALSLNSAILFDFGRAELTPGTDVALLDALTKLPDGAAVPIDGHTDCIGDDDLNMTLSQQRAEAVAEVVRAARPDVPFTVDGFGETQLVADNGTPEEDNPEGRALNRRVESAMRAQTRAQTRAQQQG